MIRMLGLETWSWSRGQFAAASASVSLSAAKLVMQRCYAIVVDIVCAIALSSCRASYLSQCGLTVRPNRVTMSKSVGKPNVPEM